MSCPISLDSSSLWQFLSLLFIFHTIAYLEIIGQLFCRKWILPKAIITDVTFQIVAFDFPHSFFIK